MLPAGELSTWNVAVQPESLVLSALSNSLTVNADCLFVLDALIAGVTGSDDAAAALGTHCWATNPPRPFRRPPG